MKADDYEDDERPVEPLPGGPPSNAEGVADLAELILTTTLGLHHAAILLAEADEKEWSAVGRRLEALKEAWARVPTGPRAGRRVGFDPRRTRRARAKR